MLAKTPCASHRPARQNVRVLPGQVLHSPSQRLRPALRSFPRRATLGVHHWYPFPRREAQMPVAVRLAVRSSLARGGAGGRVLARRSRGIPTGSCGRGRMWRR